MYNTLNLQHDIVTHNIHLAKGPSEESGTKKRNLYILYWYNNSSAKLSPLCCAPLVAEHHRGKYFTKKKKKKKKKIQEYLTLFVGLLLCIHVHLHNV